ncbi:protein ZBED8-like [Octopus sinensis]|uniref:Protein ZBED8-like n=1 Tax=Octopus sinensis TaxID=2607531 RepID=A0A6P7TR82_9MOLL|nr:protein ZBED8-like [Octopus sinensis]
MARLLIGKDAEKEFKNIPFNTISMRIHEMSKDLLEQLIFRIHHSQFPISIQLDESTDINSMCHLVAFVRFVEDDSVVDEFLFCLETTGRTRGIDIFHPFSSFLVSNNIPWTKVGPICTDGAPAMLGHRSGCIALVKDVASHIIATHCAIHKYALAVKTMPQELKIVLDSTVI